jgi:hypothetical protein
MRYRLYKKEKLIVSVGIFTGELTRAALGFCGLTDAGFRRLFVMLAHFHFAEKAFALHFFLERAERLVDVIIADDDFYQRGCTPFQGNARIKVEHA